MGGQYFAVFLTKLSHSKVELTYNLMRILCCRVGIHNAVFPGIPDDGRQNERTAGK